MKKNLKLLVSSALVALAFSASKTIHGAEGSEEAEKLYKLAQKYHWGEGLPKNYKKATEWYEEAAIQGHTNAQNNLGALYFNGEGVQKDYIQARKWFEKAAAEGDKEM
ncbi:MAG: hypothetical protein K0R76_394 [Alphaproteobacteria bacterium]|jgi:TPR repeat protein|nr:hypothetical protein [Alphaproteobacteria bacterium]MDF3033440.1 hypothetical protein [Alphaproteobacteria bacterium]